MRRQLVTSAPRFATFAASRLAARRGTRSIHSTATLKKDDDDVVPVYQNPLHHNNPELEKMFEEDFEDGEEMPIIPLPPLNTSGDPNKVMAPEHIHQLAHEVVHLNLLEIRELTEKISTHFGFDESLLASSIGGGGGGGGGAAAPVEEVVEEKTKFDVKLTGFDAKSKIKVIKEVRAMSGLGLKEAKELVEGAPKTLQKDLPMEKAEELKAKLEAVGGTVEIE